MLTHIYGTRGNKITKSGRSFTGVWYILFSLLHFVRIHRKYSILYLKRCMSVPSYYQYWLQIIAIHPRAISQNISKIWWQFFYAPVNGQWVNKQALYFLGLSELTHVCEVPCMTGQLGQLSLLTDPASSLKTVSHQTALRNIMFHYREWSTCLLNWGKIYGYSYIWHNTERCQIGWSIFLFIFISEFIFD